MYVLQYVTAQLGTQQGTQLPWKEQYNHQMLSSLEQVPEHVIAANR